MDEPIRERVQTAQVVEHQDDHCPTLDVISDDKLRAMERDGWTPTEVRALIASYRELAKHHRSRGLEEQEGDIHGD